jgi:hypothetical protein
MKTGFGIEGDTNGLENQYMNTVIDIITPVIEQSVMLAAQYAKACGRDVVLGKDFEYASKFCAMYKVGQKIGSYFPEIYEDGDEEEDDDIEIVDDDDIEFVPYSGEDELMKAITEAQAQWENWHPQSPIEEMLKNTINR